MPSRPRGRRRTTGARPRFGMRFAIAAQPRLEPFAKSLKPMHHEFDSFGEKERSTPESERDDDQLRPLVAQPLAMIKRIDRNRRVAYALSAASGVSRTGRHQDGTRQPDNQQKGNDPRQYHPRPCPAHTIIHP